jgi:pyrimidine deaminase RibD-like protein
MTEDTEDVDLQFMREAIAWAKGCNPQKESIPQVGAVIANGSVCLGRGRRGTGIEGDDDHAEWHAIHNVKNKSVLPQATLYTTLEPCTKSVRSDELRCCTELIIQHQIKRVFVGILDPNQGVTGKGLLALQNAGAEIILFPHRLAQEIRALNVPFIRAQQTLGASIISPNNLDSLKTYETQGKHPIRFKCLNPPSSNTYLFCFRIGRCWPQSGQPRHIENDVWEWDAHFGSTGIHTLHIVTANDLGQTLIEYYRELIRLNDKNRDKLMAQFPNIDKKLLGAVYQGIPMRGLPKGLRSEASVTVVIAEKRTENHRALNAVVPPIANVPCEANAQLEQHQNVLARGAAG